MTLLENNSEDQIPVEAHPAGSSLDFNSLGLADDVLQSVIEAGFTTPTPVQAAAIPVVLQQRDIVCKARTGTGKTAAFALPALSMLQPKGGVDILVITPTRELANQVCDEMARLGRGRRITPVPVFGGASIMRQIELINLGARAVVATPGRLLDLLKGGRIKKFQPQIVVLDEADEMLKMGFIDDINEILQKVRDAVPDHQTLLFSATMPAQIRRLAATMLKDPVTVNIDSTESHAPNVMQHFVAVPDRFRLEAALRLVESERPEKLIIFCRTKVETEELFQRILKTIPQAAALHGDMMQAARNHVMQKFRDGRIRILVATDVAARGLDVQGVTHVINFHMPRDPESYVHRIGRTGRAGKSGRAFIIGTPADLGAVKRLEQNLGTPLHFMEVPTLTALANQRMKRRLEHLAAVEVSDEAVQKVRDMATELGLGIDDLAARLLFEDAGSKAEESTQTAPDQIGFVQADLARIRREARRDSFGPRKFRDRGAPPRREGRSQGAGGGAGGFRGGRSNDFKKSGGGHFRKKSNASGSKPAYRN
jgi:ATP-dependent RNA helicase DeaD